MIATDLAQYREHTAVDHAAARRWNAPGQPHAISVDDWPSSPAAAQVTLAILRSQ